MRAKPDKLARNIAAGRTGATLVDLVITVLIIGILAAAAAPRFANAVARMRAEAVARRIASDLNYARRTAMQASVATTVTFRATPAGYDMTKVSHPAHPKQSYSVEIADVDSGVALSSVQFNGGLVLSFDLYGRARVSGAALTSGTVVVQSGGHSFTVAIDPSTGEASVP